MITRRRPTLGAGKGQHSNMAILYAMANGESEKVSTSCIEQHIECSRTSMLFFKLNYHSVLGKQAPMYHISRGQCSRFHTNVYILYPGYAPMRATDSYPWHYGTSDLQLRTWLLKTCSVILFFFFRSEATKDLKHPKGTVRYDLKVCHHKFIAYPGHFQCTLHSIIPQVLGQWTAEPTVYEWTPSETRKALWGVCNLASVCSLCSALQGFT